MIRISQIKLPITEKMSDTEMGQLTARAAKLLRIDAAAILHLSIVRRSIDARKKPALFFVYTVDVEVKNETQLLKRLKGKEGQFRAVEKKPYQFVTSGEKPLPLPPIIVGTGPAGLFCGYFLAKAGYRPLLLERGKEVHKRLTDVERFWREGVLDPASNVQFGEGGAGTFSDGKLTTSVKDNNGRQREVLRIFVEAGAPEEILYDAKPHIGTDILVKVVENLRNRILDWGGEIRFETQAESLIIEDGRAAGVIADGQPIRGGAVILAIGHSARDTFETLLSQAVPMEKKAFAVGLRMEHPREMIDRLQYGENARFLPTAPYKVTAQTADGRGVYSFCMCPGGYVVNASSEPGRTAINGMSYSGRDGNNSNSAMIVTVTPADYGGEGPLAGVAFQRRLEEKAYEIGKGAVPVERYGDFRAAVSERQQRMEKQDMEEQPAAEADDKGTKECRQMAKGILHEKYPRFAPEIKGEWRFAPVHDILPANLNQALVEGIDAIGRSLPGFDDGDAFVSGVESRTSSPVRILRDETGQSAIRGLYPCGEGAGYAGGIVSAAMDGILIAEKLASAYHPVIR
ncbi:MAG: NAD(P)-binding protein [Bacteroidales bacterium]|nr:NAD(P)-binding protein [Bacteroidales bacterium]MCM1416231.1 NAD(P)-binding protein [bacterium]MCM1423352.1 NAD(P)-binding protein [bacterium]